MLRSTWPHGPNVDWGRSKWGGLHYNHHVLGPRGKELSTGSWHLPLPPELRNLGKQPLSSVHRLLLSICTSLQWIQHGIIDNLLGERVSSRWYTLWVGPFFEFAPVDVYPLTDNCSLFIAHHHNHHRHHHRYKHDHGIISINVIIIIITLFIIVVVVSIIIRTSPWYLKSPVTKLFRLRTKVA